MTEIKEQEEGKPEYVYRPSIYLHAADDEEAKARTSRIRALIEQAISDDLDGQLPRLSSFTYDQAWHESDSLAERIHWAIDDDGSDRRVVE